MDPILEYLREKKLLENREVARKVKNRSARYLIVDEVLYKKGFGFSYLRYFLLEEADYVLKETHMGIYKDHEGAQSLAHRILRQGYY